MNNSEKLVVLGMSGGVDSSVCAALLKEQGYRVLGLFMRNWDEKDEHGVCTADQDFQDVIRVCEKLDIEYYSVDFVEEYRKHVFEHFLSEYKAGHTPNPDILCNREIKFNVFYKRAMELGADYLATGHYCQKVETDEGVVLAKGRDAGKDQTYFLYTIKEEILKKVLFPIGNLEKKEVRELARKYDLATQAKKDSTGICFIGERNFKDFLSQYIATQKGQFLKLENGQVMGEHDGYCFYTIGQRKGLGIGGPGGPWFVADKSVEDNTVFVVEGEHHPALYVDFLIAGELSWVGSAPVFPKKLKAKVRYRQQDQECMVEFLSPDKLKVIFTHPQRAVAIRQSVVFYEEDVCIGGGMIVEVGPSYYLQKKILPVTLGI